jgi:hypothetical protein
MRRSSLASLRRERCGSFMAKRWISDAEFTRSNWHDSKDFQSGNFRGYVRFMLHFLGGMGFGWALKAL